MKKDKKTHGQGAKEGLSQRIGRTFNGILRRVLLIVCLESVLLGGSWQCFIH